MQFMTIVSTAVVGLVSLANASPVAKAAAVEDRSAYMFEYCTDTGLGGSCWNKVDDGNLNVCGTFWASPSKPFLSLDS